MSMIVQHSVRLMCDTKKAYEMYTVNERLQAWLTEIAEVEPRPGGKYELFWDPDNRDNNSTIGCRITAMEKEKFLAFEWKGPTQFKHFMNEVRPLTNVVIFFIPYPEGTEVHLLHTSWRDTPEWEEARQWFDKAWAMVLSELQKYVGGDESAKPCE